MKLLKKNTRYLLIYLPIILVLCSIIFYILLSRQINHLHDKQLLLKQENIITNLKKHKGEIEEDHSIAGEYSIVETKAKSPGKRDDKVSDTLIFLPSQNKYLPFKKRTGLFTFNDKQYEITTFSSSTETTHTIITVFIIYGFICFVLLFSIVIINRKFSTKLWKPFYESINELSNYDISKNIPINLKHETGVTEFDELNRVANQLIFKDHHAYQSRKEFVENASHEIQTPLAIIRSKAELLMEQPDLNEKTAELINDIAEATTRLSNLNKTLLLLAKIENKQFLDQKKINLSETIEKCLSNLEQVFDGNLPQIKKDLDNSTFITGNQALTEILFNNLIRNAIVHNVHFGNINIVLKHKLFSIENTGPALTIAPELLFERFKKDSNKQNQTGLGLAIVKQICTLYDYKLSYTYQDHIHRLQIHF